MDSGVFAPVLTFQKLFEAEGVPVTDDEVRGPMGVHKRVGEVIAADCTSIWSGSSVIFHHLKVQVIVNPNIGEISFY